MLTFIADPRNNGTAGGDACNTCCCDPAYGRPGETNQWQIIYSHWVASISGPGLIAGTSFDVAKIADVPPSGTNQPPVNRDHVFVAHTDAPVAGNVGITGAGLVYSVIALYGPSNGTVTMTAATGEFVYVPRPGFNGYDAFYFTTSDGVNIPVTNKVELAISPIGVAAIPLPPVIPRINVPRNRVMVERNRIRFPVEISPAVSIGDRYRISIRQPAADCDGNTFYHVFCSDLTIGKC